MARRRPPPTPGLPLPFDTYRPDAWIRQPDDPIDVRYLAYTRWLDAGRTWATEHGHDPDSVARLMRAASPMPGAA